MIDIELLRQKPELFRDSLKKRGTSLGLIDQVLSVDKTWREKLQAIEQLRSRQHDLSKATGDRTKAKQLKVTITKEEKDLKKLGDARQNLLSQVPNLISPRTPVGLSEETKKVIKRVKARASKYQASHEELMTKLSWLNTDKASQISGTRFRYLLSEAAKAHLNLLHQAFQFACSKGYQPVIPPVLMREEAMKQAGFFPFGREDTYFLPKDNLYLAGTSEIALLSLFGNSVFEEKSLPLRLVGFSSCFRREAGSYGKDVRGIFRQHQFDKVELISICQPSDSDKELAYLVKTQEEFVKKFAIPYQIVEIVSGDLAAKEYRKQDLECWFPSQKNYRETHSASNCTDFQSRGLNIKLRPADNEKLIYAHCLNATLATERLLIAIVENYQGKEGQVNLPKSLI